MTAITYTWIIAQLDCAPSEDGLSDVVKTIHWRYQATADADTADCYGTCTVGDVDPDSFTPYAKLTQKQIIGWLESSLDVDKLQENLKTQLEHMANPPITTPDLPWSAS